MPTRKPRKTPPVKVLSTYELMQLFPDEEAAIRYLATLLWPDGPVCPHCGSNRNTPRKSVKNFHSCNDCRKDFSIRVGTIFEGSHIPLHKWLYAMYMIVTSRKGISSLQLSKEIGVTQKSAWFLEHRIRAACGNQCEKILSGIVEVDETYLGGIERNKHESKKLNQGRGAVGKTAVMGMRERDGHVVAKVVRGTDKETLQGAIKKTVTEGTTVCTDEHGSYDGLEGEYTHKTVKHSAKQYVDEMGHHTNGVESVWALLKRAFYGIHHWFSVEHMQRYVDETVFRLNEGNCKISTEGRLRSMILGMRGKRLTYKELIRFRGQRLLPMSW